MSKWALEVKNYVKDNYQEATSIKALLSMVNAYFETDFTMKQLANFLWKNHKKIGLQLRKRSAYSNYPMYSEKLNNKGYVLVKVSMIGTQYEKWRTKHSFIWEQTHGKIPKGMQIIFLDNNRRNFAIENLAMVSRQENLALTRYGLRSDNREVTLAGIVAVKHSIAIYDRLKKKLGSREYNRFIKRGGCEAIRERTRMEEQNGKV